MNLKDSLLENPLVYGLWSKPLDTQKHDALRQVLPHREGLRVLDVGCGPATNTGWFDADGYFGIDYNPAYIEQASRRFPERSFAVQDAAALDVGGRQFDLVLVNSLLHHLTDDQGKSMLAALAPALAPNGFVILNEPLIPPRGSWFKQFMMKGDRGAFFRSHTQYLDLFAPAYTVAAEHAYEMRLLGLAGWSMMIFKLVLS
jgi:ubiquinone/menaquinone biosynthesis C-methylase UbiE